MPLPLLRRLAVWQVLMWQHQLPLTLMLLLEAD